MGVGICNNCRCGDLGVFLEAIETHAVFDKFVSFYRNHNVKVCKTHKCWRKLKVAQKKVSLCKIDALLF